jgi:hypothetical protein
MELEIRNRKRLVMKAHMCCRLRLNCGVNRDIWSRKATLPQRFWQLLSGCEQT